MFEISVFCFFFGLCAFSTSKCCVDFVVSIVDDSFEVHPVGSSEDNPIELESEDPSAPILLELGGLLSSHRNQDRGGGFVFDIQVSARAI